MEIGAIKIHHGSVGIVSFFFYIFYFICTSFHLFYSEPKQVTLEGNFKSKENETVTIECSYGETNPNINRVIFLVDNKEVQSNTESVSHFSN